MQISNEPKLLFCSYHLPEQKTTSWLFSFLIIYSAPFPNFHIYLSMSKPK